MNPNFVLISLQEVEEEDKQINARQLPVACLPFGPGHDC
jgi:hypothetical protein